MLNENPKVSVCIPTYNSAIYLGEAIKSVLNQTFTDFELIISDNASNDNTQEVVKSFSDPRIKYYKNKKNIGMYPNFNKCVEYTSGEYIKFLSADDCFHPKLLDLFLTVMSKSHKIGLGICSNEWVNENGQFIQYCERYSDNLIIDGKKAFREFLFLGNGGASPSAVMVRRNCFNEIGNFKTINETGWGNDWELWMRILAKYDFTYIAEPLVSIRRHEKTGTYYVYKHNLDIVGDYRVLHYIFDNIDKYIELTYKEKRKALWRIGNRGIWRFLYHLKNKELKQAKNILTTLKKYDSILIVSSLFIYLVFHNKIKRILKL